KSYGGNLAIKIDIAKAFDTIDWKILLKVLSAFGFCPLFCNWIHTILHSAKFSISINGKQEGYFDCSRGVRQGDPLSPLLFGLAEEVLSRGLTKLVDEGTSSNIQVLSNFFAKYAQISGQVINPQKSTIFAGSLSNDRLHFIASSIGFNIVSLIKELERYLRNFLWSGDLNTRKTVTVSWSTVCSSIDEGGL
ncbi:ribonuclease H, partial [Trifolium pratense]